MTRHLRRFLAPALLLLASPLPRSTALEPEPAKAPFPVAGPVQGVIIEQIAGNLSSVTAITYAGDDGRLFLTIRDGRIVIFENGIVHPQPFLDIRGQVSTSGERGLLSTAFHPRYAENGFFFINYTDRAGDTVIARYRVATGDPNRADAASARILLIIGQPFANHNGGQIQFGPDGFLYIGMGDGGAAFDPECRAQKTNDLLGKMLRIDVDQNVAAAPFYGIPASNPFRGPGDPADEIWASGFRNPWRFSFDRQTGDLWMGDVGQNHREEIDFQPASSHGGENYGWKVMEGTLCSTSDACPASTPACDSAAFTPPVLEYDHDPHCSVTGGYVYRGARLAQLRGAYVFGDFCSGVIWAAFRQGAGFTVRTITASASQLTTFGEDAAGELYAATLSGRLFRVTSDSSGPKAETVGLFEPQASRFQLKKVNSAAGGVQTVRFGPRGRGWLPLAGDWDGDGKTTIGLYDPATAIFRLKNSLQGGASDVIVALDAPSANVVPLAGDWNGDGRDTVGVYDPTTGIFHFKNSFQGSGFDMIIESGPPDPAQVPVTGDWNGNGTDDIGFFDPGKSLFILPFVFAPDGPPLMVQVGPPGRNAIPVIGDWDGNGLDGIGVYDPAAAVFRLKNGLSAGNPDLTFRFGPRRGGWLPLAGAW
jgi:glucose/arabinose dehydrogenase